MLLLWANPLVWPLKTELHWVPFCPAHFTGDQQHPLNSHVQSEGLRILQDLKWQWVKGALCRLLATCPVVNMIRTSWLNCFPVSTATHAVCVLLHANGHVLSSSMWKWTQTGNMQSFKKKISVHKRVKGWGCGESAAKCGTVHSFPFSLFSILTQRASKKKDHFEMKMQNRWNKSYIILRYESTSKQLQ